MSPLGPFGPERRIAVAVSGGSDSLCLAWLASRWGNVLCFIVDHGLRPESATEACWTHDQLSHLNVRSKILTLKDLMPGPAMAERARDARHAVLEQACRQAGLTDLLLGHHLRDQAETLLMRRLAGSGEAGLAAMSVIAERNNIRLLRPFLNVAPGRLRATLAQIGQNFIEDPSNRDQRAHRPYLRARLNDPDGNGPRIARLAQRSARAARWRTQHDAEIAAELAERVTILPAGCAIVSGELSAASLANLLRTISGRAHLPPRDAADSIARHWRPATLHGCRIMQAGRLEGDWLVARELNAIETDRSVVTGTKWDGRFEIGQTLNGDCTIGMLGHEQAKHRKRTDLPAYVLAGTPAIRHENTILAAPFFHLPTNGAVHIVFKPTVPLAAAAFFYGA